MDNSNIEQLKKLSRVFNTDNVITSDEIEQVLTGVLSIMNSFKKDNENLTKEAIAVVNGLLEKVNEESQSIKESTVNTVDLSKKEIQSIVDLKLNEVKKLIKEAKATKPKNGKDADESRVVKNVLAQIKLPEYKPTLLDTPKEIKDKLETLEGDERLDISAIKGVDKLATQANLERGISILDQRTQFLINKTPTNGTSSPLTTKGDVYTYSTTNDRLPVGTNGQVLTADSSTATGLKWAASGGGGVSFGTTTQIPFMNAGGTDFSYTGDLTWNNTNKQFRLGVLNAQAEDILKVVNASGTELTRLDEQGNLLVGIPESDQAVALGRVHTRTTTGSTAQDLIIGPFVGNNDIETEFGSTFRMGIGGQVSWVLGGSVGTGLYNHGFGDNVSPTTARMVVRGKTTDSTDAIFDGQDSASSSKFYMRNDGNMGIGINTPTARLNITAGTATAGTAPLKLTTGTALTTPEDGAMEYHGSHLYFTIGSTRYQLDQQSGGSGTVTSVTSANGDATVATTTTTPVITIVSAPKLTTARTIGTLTGDITTAGSSFDGTGNNTNATVLATVNSNVGAFGSATQSPTFTVNAKGLTTAAANVTITPAVGSITGLGTGVATALAVNVGTAGAPVVNGGALGTPSSGTITNLTGTASININGTVGATTPTTGVFTTLVANATTSLLLGTAGSAVGNIGFRNATSGTITLAPPTGALGTVTLTLPAVTDTLMGRATTDTITAVKTFSTAPVFNALPTGTAVTSAATASTIVTRDANANISFNNWLGGYSTTATAAGTTTLTVASGYLQYFTGSTTQTVTMPVTSTLTLGHEFRIVNNSTGAVTVNSSGGNAILIVAAGTSAIFDCILTSGTTAASWSYSYVGIVSATGKKLTVSNTITLAGTDGTTLTMPSATDTVVGRTSTDTLTNKRVQPRTVSSTTSSNLSPDLSSANVYYRTTQTATLTIDAPIGTPVIGETIMIYVDSVGAQTLTINATYVAFGAAFPATTTAGKTFMMSAQYTGSVWRTTWANQV